MEDIILVGHGGHAKSVADCIERQHKYKIIGYTDVKPCDSRYEYLGTDTVLKDWFERGIKKAAVGIGYMGKVMLRQKLYEQLKHIGYVLPVIADPSAVISGTVQIGEGAFIGKRAVINTEAQIGTMAIINTLALIEHECIVGDFSHIAVGAVLCGQVKTGEAVFVGANATILQCVDVPANIIVPAGEIIRKGYCMRKKNNYKMIRNTRGGKG